MRLSHFILAVSAEELKSRHPALSKQLDFAVSKDLASKYYHWLVAHLNNGAEVERLVNLASKFETALKSKKLEGLIAKKKLPPQAKDIGWWQKPQVDIPDRGKQDSLVVMEEAVKEADETKSRTDIKSSEAAKIYDNGRVVVFVPKTKGAVCLLGANTKWCITQKNQRHWEDYTKQGSVFFLLLDTSPWPPHNPWAKMAINVNITSKRDPLGPKTDTEVFDAQNNGYALSDLVTAYGKEWPPIEKAIRSYLKIHKFTIERGPADFWLGDEVALKAFTGEDVSSLLNDNVNSVAKEEMNIWTREFDEKESKLAGLAKRATGALVRKNVTPAYKLRFKVEWKPTGNKLVDKILKLYNKDQDITSERLKRYLKVITPIDPSKSVDHYGLDNQPRN